MDELHDGMKRVYAGAFNVMSQDWQDDGSVIVTIHSHGDAEAVTMHVSDLYGPDEDVHVAATLPLGAADHIAKRQEESADVALEFDTRPDRAFRPAGLERAEGAARSALRDGGIS